MDQKNFEVLKNIIGAVETGGQIYGKKDYKRYTPPGKNTKNEETISLGWWQAYGHEARQLIQAIYDEDRAAFWRLDTAEIEEMLPYDWEKIKWHPKAKQKAALIAMIDSPVGHAVQDRLFAEKMTRLIADCAAEYTEDIKAQMMYCEIRHLGGKKAVDRIFQRCVGNFSPDAILASLAHDQKDKSSDNQVGDAKYWSRHIACSNMIDRYAVTGEMMAEIEHPAIMVPAKKAEEDKVTEKDITLCGHGSGTPRLIRMDTYLTERYKKTASSGEKTWHKGVVAVVRPIGMTDELRDLYVKTYSTIIGRNIYSQPLRQYCYTPYNGKYYSDCSSSQCLTLEKIGLKVSSLNTVGMYQSSKFEKVPVKIVGGHIKNPEILKVGDMLLFAGADPDRVLHIGHVEGVFEIRGASPDPGEKTGVKAFQGWLNLHYPDLVEQVTGDLLDVDGKFGKDTTAAAVTVWKYMVNKYYRGDLTIGNVNFHGSCKEAAKKITFQEVKKHGTLTAILQGLLSKTGDYTGAISAVADKALEAAVASYNKKAGITGEELTPDTWYKLFN